MGATCCQIGLGDLYIALLVDGCCAKEITIALGANADTLGDILNRAGELITVASHQHTVGALVHSEGLVFFHVLAHIVSLGLR